MLRHLQQAKGSASKLALSPYLINQAPRLECTSHSCEYSSRKVRIKAPILQCEHGTLDQPLDPEEFIKSIWIKISLNLKRNMFALRIDFYFAGDLKAFRNCIFRMSPFEQTKGSKTECVWTSIFSVTSPEMDLQYSTCHVADLQLCCCSLGLRIFDSVSYPDIQKVSLRGIRVTTGGFAIDAKGCGSPFLMFVPTATSLRRCSIRPRRSPPSMYSSLGDWHRLQRTATVWFPSIRGRSTKHKVSRAMSKRTSSHLT